MTSTTRSDLLATCLRIAEVEEYIDVIEKYGIDTFSLKLLKRDDLEVLGITDKSKQDIFLEKISSLLIPSEEMKTTIIDQEYIHLVVYLISIHLQKHLASLSCAVRKNDVIVNDVKLIQSLTCLRKCITSLQNECELCRKLVRPLERNSNTLLYSVVVGTFLVGSFIWLKSVFVK